MGDYEIRETRDGKLDEFIARGVTVHFERMSPDTFWCGVNFPDGDMAHVNFSADGGLRVSVWVESPRGEQFAHGEVDRG